MFDWFKRINGKRVSIPRGGVLSLGPLAVPDNEPWWITIHQIIDEAELETIQGARRRTKDTNACIAAVGAGEGVALVREKLIQARQLALKGRQDAKGNESAQRI